MQKTVAVQICNIPIRENVFFLIMIFEKSRNYTVLNCIISSIKENSIGQVFLSDVYVIICHGDKY